MRTLVTGGAGFIGSTLVDRLLAEGHEVDVVDDLSTGNLANLADARGDRGDRSRRFSFHRLDIRSPAITELMEMRKPEVVFHLAAQADVRVSVANPTFDAEVNVIGSLNVFQGAVAAKARKVVFAGSGGTLYGTPAEIPVKEGHPQRPESPYGVSTSSTTARSTGSSTRCARSPTSTDPGRTRTARRASCRSSPGCCSARSG